MRIVVIISSNSPEKVWNAFRFANTSLVYGNQVNVFLLGSGVEAASISTLKYDVAEQIAVFRESDGTLIGCGVCCENRKDEMPYLQQDLNCEIGSMQQLYDLVAAADKTLTF